MTDTRTITHTHTHTATESRQAYLHFANQAIEKPAWELWNDLYALMVETGLWQPRKDKEQGEADQKEDLPKPEKPVDSTEQLYIAGLHQTLEAHNGYVASQLDVNRVLIDVLTDRLNPELHSDGLSGVIPNGLFDDFIARLATLKEQEEISEPVKMELVAPFKKIRDFILWHVAPWGVFANSEDEYLMVIASKMADGTVAAALEHEGVTAKTSQLYQELIDEQGEGLARDTAAGLALFTKLEYQRKQAYIGTGKPQGLRSASGILKLLKCTDDLAARIYSLWQKLPRSPLEDYANGSLGEQAIKEERGNYENTPDVVITYDHQSGQYLANLHSKWKRVMRRLATADVRDRFQSFQRIVNNRAFLEGLKESAVLADWEAGAEAIKIDGKSSPKAAALAGEMLYRNKAADKLGHKMSQALKLYEQKPSIKGKNGSHQVTMFEAGIRVSLGKYNGLLRSMSIKPDFALALAKLQHRYLQTRDDFDLARVTVEDVMRESGHDALPKRTAERYLKGLVLKVEGVGNYRAIDLMTTSGYAGPARSWWNAEKLSAYQIMGYICEILRESEGEIKPRDISMVRKALIKDYLLGQYNPHAKTAAGQYKGISYKTVQNYLRELVTHYPERVGLTRT